MVAIIRESGKWYDRAGLPVDEVASADGKRRVRATLAHARKFGYLPSVTSIGRQLDKPGLRVWRDGQLIEAALSLPRPDSVTLQQWNDPAARRAAILADAEAQVEAAADRGKDWHAVIEGYLIGQKSPEPGTVEDNVCTEISKWLAAELGPGFTCTVERTVIGDGFAGTPDVLAQDRDLTKTLLADIKTVADDSPLLEGKGRPHDEWQYQIAAYWRCTDADAENCWEVIVGRESGRVRLHHWTQDDIMTGWRAFSLLRQLWCIRNKYDPLSWAGKPEEVK